MKQKLFLLLALPFCWASTWALDQVGGVYQIGSAQDLVDFATLVNGGNTGANAVLTANIDLDGTAWTPIGNNTTAYTGTFDGKGFNITGFSYTSTGNGGLFGKVGSASVSATIKNFSIIGTLNVTSNKYAGVIAQAIKSSISNVHSSLTINATGGDHVGGVVGSTENTENVSGTTINGCSYNGTMTVSGAGNFAGIVGYVSKDFVTNSANYGNITYSTANCAAGGIIGYINNASVSVQNCLNTGSISYDGTGSPSYGGAIIGRHRKVAANITNNYWLAGSARQSSGTTVLSAPAATSVSAAELASGNICFLLNESTQGGVWRQSLTTDNYPTLDSSHKMLYQWHEVSYNDVPDLLISNENDLKTFSDIVNAGAFSVNATMTANIDIASFSTTWIPIGNWAQKGGVTDACYKGHFDGQGHTITFNATSTQNYFGIFGVISTGALIENFSINGTITSNVANAGVIGYARDTNPTIRNIHSSLNINNTRVGSRIGGILGNSNNGTVVVDRCTYSGTLDGKDNADKGNYGGIVGYLNNDKKANLQVTNCLFDGKLKNTADTPGNCTFGGIVGYVGANPEVTVTNCLSIGTLQSAVTGQFYGAVKHNTCSIVNSFYQGDNINGSSSTVTPTTQETTLVDDTKLASGEVAYKLGSAWYQTLGTDADATPVLDSNSEKVLYVGAAGYSTMYDTANGWELVGDAKAYIGTINGSALHLDEIADIPARTAVVISGTYYNKVSTTATANTTDNVLKGSNGSVKGDEGIYALAIKNDKVGFYPVAANVTIPAGKAYLEYTGTGGNGENAVKGFTFVFDDDATGIEDLKDSKDLKDSNVIYNIAGQRLDNSQFTIHNSQLKRGIYIVNGKKVLK